MTLINLLGPTPPPDPERTARVKQWVREVFGLHDDTVVMVTQLRCTEPGCPPLETVLAVLEDKPGPPRSYKVHQGLDTLTRADVEALRSIAQE